MSVNSVGPNVGPSSLLTSYLEKQNAAPTAQAAPALQTAPVTQSAQNVQTAPLQTFSTQSPMQTSPVQFPAAQTQVVQPQAPAATVPEPQTEPIALNPKENEAKKPENEAENEAKKPNFINKFKSKTKELFKNPKAKKIAAGISAAIVISGIVIFALCSRKKPQVSPGLESALQDFVDTMGDFFNPGK